MNTWNTSNTHTDRFCGGPTGIFNRRIENMNEIWPFLSSDLEVLEEMRRLNEVGDLLLDSGDGWVIRATANEGGMAWVKEGR